MTTGTAIRSHRTHLVERAVEGFGGSAGLKLLAWNRRDAEAEQDPAKRPAPSPAERAADPPARAPAIPITALLRAGLAAAPGSAERSRLTEEIALVQAQVLRTVAATLPAEDRCGRVVLVTSARPGEGKTFTALNIAASIASDGAQPVILVDADGKQGNISSMLGQSDAPGLRSLAGDVARHPASLLVPTEICRMALLPFGALLPGESGTPPGAAVTAAILRLAAALPDHIIILDAPPCLSSSDPSLLASIAGQVVMVVEAERTQRGEVESALDMVDTCPTLQLLLNRVRLTTRDSFGAYGSYGGQGADAGP